MKIIIIGSSTGGPYILEQIMSTFPSVQSAIIIVQHLPPSFSRTFRNHIASLTKMETNTINEMSHLTEERIFIAPAGFHLLLEHNRLFVLNQEEKVHGVRPSIDLTLLSCQKRVEDKIMGIILTGMGRDGADGICHIHQIGGITIAQDPATSPIKSMPQAAIETGEVDYVLTPEKIREKMILFGEKKIPILGVNHKPFMG